MQPGLVHDGFPFLTQITMALVYFGFAVSVLHALGLQWLHNGFVQLSALAVSLRQSDCKEQGSANTQIQIQEAKYKSTNTNWPLFNWRHQIIHNVFFLVLLLSSLQQVCNGQWTMPQHYSGWPLTFLLSISCFPVMLPALQHWVRL